MRTLIFYLLILHSSLLVGQNDTTSVDSLKISDTTSPLFQNNKEEKNNTKNIKIENEPKSNKESSLNWAIILGLIGVFGSALAWTFNEWQKRVTKLTAEKEERYRKLISLIRAFGSGSHNIENGNEFISEFQLCWMYCPDTIILKGNSFISTLTKESKTKPDAQNLIDIAKGELVLEMRKDLILTSKLIKIIYKKCSLTKLVSSDFKDVYYHDD